MKKLSYLLIVICAFGNAQIKGNSNIETRTFPFENVEIIKINIYADIIIDYASEEKLEITTDSNLFEFIDKEVVGNTVDFEQIKWISPSKNITIRIGAPNLKRVVHDTHDTTVIKNVNSEEFRVNANIGKVIIEGTTKELRLGTEIGQIDASKIEAEEVFVNIWSYGTIKVNPKSYLWADVSDNGKLLYEMLPESNKIKTKSGGVAMKISEYEAQEKDLEWISFKIKNNSPKRNNFTVRGPKADGSFFGYGFPMNANAVKKEKWSVGTKIYAQTKLGFKKLLVEITAEDEGKVIELF